MSRIFHCLRIHPNSSHARDGQNPLSEESFFSMLSNEIVRVLFNADMEIRVGEGEGTVQAGMKFISMFYN